MTLGEKIKKIRKEAQLTQQQLAEKTRLSNYRVISHYETGVRLPSLAMLNKIAAACGYKKFEGNFVK